MNYIIKIENAYFGVRKSFVIAMDPHLETTTEIALATTYSDSGDMFEYCKRMMDIWNFECLSIARVVIVNDDTIEEMMRI